MPSFRSSPWILGAPQIGLARLGSSRGPAGEFRAALLVCRSVTATCNARTSEIQHDANGRQSEVRCKSLEAGKNQTVHIAEREPFW